MKKIIMGLNQEAEPCGTPLGTRSFPDLDWLIPMYRSRSFRHLSIIAGTPPEDRGDTTFQGISHGRLCRRLSEVQI